MAFTTNSLARLALWLMVVSCVTAVLIGRTRLVPGPAPRPGCEATAYAAPRYRGYDGYWFPTERHSPRLLDRESGQVVTLPLSDAERLEWVCCSPWQDKAGRFQLVGRWLGRSKADLTALPFAVGLARCSLPDGEVLDRIALDRLPTGNPCWYPDGSSRVLYAAAGQLYQVAFCGGEVATRSDPAEAVPPRPLPWRARPLSTSIDYIQDLHWTNDGALTLRCPLLASLSFWQRDASPGEMGKHLWWLDLGRDGTEIVGAGLLIASESADVLATRAEERHPVVGTDAGGKTRLAYLVREHGCWTWDLWLATIERGGAGTEILVPTSAGRKVAEGCEPVVPAFSLDGRWVYVVRQLPGNGRRLERFPVARIDEPVSLAAK